MLLVHKFIMTESCLICDNTKDFYNFLADNNFSKLLGKLADSIRSNPSKKALSLPCRMYNRQLHFYMHRTDIYLKLPF